MAHGELVRTSFAASEADEVRQLLDELPDARLAVRRMSMARMRRMGLGIASGDTQPTTARFDALISEGRLRIESDEVAAIAAISPHPSGNVFRVAVGVTGEPVPEDWNAFDQRYQWFGQHPQSVTSGAHLFALAVDRWKSAVVGLYEAVSAGAAELPNSPNARRWPWALGVRPLAAIPPPLAKRVVDLTGPQSGLPASVPDPAIQELLYKAVAKSPPPPGPSSLEQRVQELEWRDVAPDIFQAVLELGKKARRDAVIARATELGDWTSDELSARAWYTTSGVGSHIDHILSRVLMHEQGLKGQLEQVHGIYSLQASPAIGEAYRPAGGRESTQRELPPNLIDLSELDRATERHMELQDDLAEALGERGVEPRSPTSWQPQFDLLFENGGRLFVVEVKSGRPASAQQLRLGSGQVLEYRHRLEQMVKQEVRPALLIESVPPEPWMSLTSLLGISLLRADHLERSLEGLLSG